MKNRARNTYKGIFGKKSLFGFITVFLAAIYATSQIAAPLYGLSTEQKNLYMKGINYFDAEVCSSVNSDASELSAGSGSPTGLTFPGLAPEAMAKAIDKFINKTNSTSGLGGLGKTIVASAEQADVSPFLIVGIANKESGLADPSMYNMKHGNNAFGRKAGDGQPFFMGAGPNAGTKWYKWSSTKASVDYTAPENKDISGGGDIATYLRKQYSKELDANDKTALMSIYGDNVAEYVNNLNDWIGEMAELTTKQEPTNSAPRLSLPSDLRNVYMIGDSITVRARDDLLSEFANNSTKPDVTINASVGRSIRTAGQNPRTTGLDAVRDDKGKVKEADAIVVALGTNGLSEADISAMINAIKDIKKEDGSVEEYQIFWVNLFSTYPSVNQEERNKMIDGAAADKGYTIIDTIDKVDLEKGGDQPNLHQTVGTGSKQFAKLVVDGVLNGSASSRASLADQGSCECEAVETVAGTLPSSVPEPHNGLFTEAANKYGVNPQYLAALFMTENGNIWKPFDTQWASSHMGASGPFQFMPGTWEGYGVDGNNDGRTDINNMEDSAYSAGNLLKGLGVNKNTTLGTLDQPYKPGTFLYAAAAYNWGIGNVQMSTSPSSPLSAGPEETVNYLKNSYELIKSGFTKSGHPNYGNPRSGGESPDGSSNSTNTNQQGGCSGDVISGDVVEVALSFAWDTNGHGKEKSDAKPEYQKAMPKYNGSTGTDEWSDCGVFIATVMVASGADPDYPKRGTLVQQPYLEQNSGPNGKYEKIGTTTMSTADLKPGDILINTGHTFMYVGPQPKGFAFVGASLHGHVPQASGLYGPEFTIYRLK